MDEHGNVIGIVSAKLNASVALAASGSLPENVNYVVKSSLLLSFLESVPDVSAKLKTPSTVDRKSEDVVKSAQQAAVLVLVLDVRRIQVRVIKVSADNRPGPVMSRNKRPNHMAKSVRASCTMLKKP